MTLGAGAKLGPYEILSPLGAGGMGEVYRARDTRLGREVAVKILPERYARDTQFRQRFEREARAVSSLQHAHICVLHDVGHEEMAGEFLVMELLEGETVAERLKRGKLPLPELLKIGMQIADALDKAHRKGMVHRDLKPGNIMLTKSGAKLMDFGLAKPASLGTPGGVVSAPLLSAAVTADGASPASPLTSAGTMVGTIQYMSPEQIEGKDADARSDIFALGATLYEMATGERAFQGKSQISVASAILEKDPEPISKTQPLAPAALDRVVAQCLAKNPDDRFQCAHDVGLELSWIAGEAGLLRQPEHGDPKPRLQRALPWALVFVLALVAAGIGTWAWLAPRGTAAPPVLAYIPPPPGTSFRFFGFSAGPVVVSPDGRNLAFSATDQKGVTRIWVRPLAGRDANAIAGTEDGAQPFWSPDGQSLGFFADEKLKTVTLDGGTVKVLGDAFCGDGAWSSEGSILFVPQCGGPIAAIPATGGTARPVVQPGSGASEVGSPSPLPGGDEFLYVSYQFREPSPAEKERLPSIRMASLSTGKSEPVLSDARSPQFASGHLLFLRGGSVYAQRFDPGNGNLKGEAVPLAEARAYSTSPNGALAFQGAKTDARLEWFDRNGNSLGTLGGVELWLAPRISPDGKRVLAFAEDSQTHRSADLWSYPAKGGVGTRLTFGPGYKGFSVWSPDGKYIAYTCSLGGILSICRKPGDGSGAEETLLKLRPEVLQAAVIDWSPDGRYLSFDEQTGKERRWSNWVLPLDGGQKPFQAAPVNANQYDGNFSPDGHWLAYFSYETGRPEVFVVPFPVSGGKFQISQNGGWMARWAAGNKLFFTTMGNRLMEARLATSGKSVQVQSLEPLFQLDLPTTSGPLYDVTPDGSRFIAAASADPNASQSITLLLNWEIELKSK